MRRLTRKIGLFGGPAAMMTAAGVKKPATQSPAASTPEKKAPEAAAASPSPARKSWLRRLFGLE